MDNNGDNGNVSDSGYEGSQLNSFDGHNNDYHDDDNDDDNDSDENGSGSTQFCSVSEASEEPEDVWQAKSFRDGVLYLYSASLNDDHKADMLKRLHLVREAQQILDESNPDHAKVSRTLRNFETWFTDITEWQNPTLGSEETGEQCFRVPLFTFEHWRDFYESIVDCYTSTPPQEEVGDCVLMAHRSLFRPFLTTWRPPAVTYELSDNCDHYRRLCDSHEHPAKQKIYESLLAAAKEALKATMVQQSLRSYLCME